MATKITNAALLAVCRQMLKENISYDDMDCQAAVEEALMRCGVPKKECDLGGSNSHYRNCWWRGTPERCCELLGIKEVPAGIGTFDLKPVSDTTPVKFRTDGYGDSTHMGIYMLNGETFNSSHSKGGVTIAVNFKGKKGVNGGTNMVGFLPWVDCGLTDVQMAALRNDANYTGNEPVVASTGTPVVTQEGVSALPTVEATITYGVVVAANGGDVRAREAPKPDAIWKYEIPNGRRVLVLGEKGNYYKVDWLGKGRWVQKNFIQIE